MYFGSAGSSPDWDIVLFCWGHKPDILSPWCLCSMSRLLEQTVLLSLDCCSLNLGDVSRGAIHVCHSSAVSSVLGRYDYCMSDKCIPNNSCMSTYVSAGKRTPGGQRNQFRDFVQLGWHSSPEEKHSEESHLEECGRKVKESRKPSQQARRLPPACSGRGDSWQ